MKGRMSSCRCLNAGTAVPIEMILLKVSVLYEYTKYLCIAGRGAICQSHHKEHCNKTNVGTCGGQPVHVHRIGEVSLGGIFPNFHCPYKEINADGEQAGCQDIKFFYFQGEYEIITQHQEGHGV